MGLFRDSFVRVISISPKSLFAEEVSLLNRVSMKTMHAMLILIAIKKDKGEFQNESRVSR